MSLSLRDLKVSDHALLRYLERKFGLELDKMRAEVLPTCPNMLAAIDKLGDGTYAVPGSHRVRVVNRVVVTVLPEEKDDYQQQKAKKPHFTNRKNLPR